jgi:hypothetical protein
MQHNRTSELLRTYITPNMMTPSRYIYIINWLITFNVKGHANKSTGRCSIYYDKNTITVEQHTKLGIALSQQDHVSISPPKTLQKAENTGLLFFSVALAENHNVSLASYLAEQCEKEGYYGIQLSTFDLAFHMKKLRGHTSTRLQVFIPVTPSRLYIIIMITLLDTRAVRSIYLHVTYLPSQGLASRVFLKLKVPAARW